MNRCLNPNDLHLIGITCMFIASKYEDLLPIRLETLCEKAGFGKFRFTISGFTAILLSEG